MRYPYPTRTGSLWIVLLPLLESFLSKLIKSKNLKIVTFYSVDLHYYQVNECFYQVLIKIDVNIVCTLLLTGKHDWRISKVTKCKIKSCFAPCDISFTLPLSSGGARSVTS